MRLASPVLGSVVQVISLHSLATVQVVCPGSGIAVTC